MADRKDYKGPTETCGIFRHVHCLDCVDSFIGQYLINFIHYIYIIYHYNSIKILSLLRVVISK